MKITLLLLTAFAVVIACTDAIQCLHCFGFLCHGAQPKPCRSKFCLGAKLVPKEGDPVVHKYCLHKASANDFCDELKNMKDSFKEILCYVCDSDKCNAQDGPPSDASRVDKFP